MTVFSTWDDLKRNAPGVIFFSGAFAIMFMLAANQWANDATPIRSVDAVDATIKSAQWKQHNIVYVLALDDGSAVLIEDERPHLIGSHVSVEHVTRENGLVFYRFAQ
ncbi:MAG: hypothetical protein E5V49_14125 [Mesorhizobium sp.]|nr:hypothetical protein EN848_09890 [bacterium M00.F.Ca.ET.205.01.1.1]TGU55733.1 hypothetical protein EN795_03135 [bacterium M00.F.Ca.ET.152.01.1.1]TGV39992.1 hypothetical protein EN829_001290 [Mesorhizobium sp. M00.F.Ca.ET.186.01.1.1]TGZ44975.1 hypothetical protein EN805_01285 [bacterium M00.F.Ca.ET.162.01.1.1]TIW60051.1 MAG: hypothetical protein E5V48_15415 [Mesorhizobium sp.]